MSVYIILYTQCNRIIGTHPSSRVIAGLQNMPGTTGHKTGALPRQGASPSQGTHMQSHIIEVIPRRQLATLRVFGRWLKARVPGGNACKYKESMKSHRVFVQDPNTELCRCEATALIASCDSKLRRSLFISM